MSNHYSRNSDFLFIYDAKMCNPNGDPDDENKPRMDYATRTNLVSDVRLKRYIRNYLQGLGHEIFVSKVDDKTVDATKRIAYAIVLNKNSELFESKQEEIKELEDKLNKNERLLASDITKIIDDVQIITALFTDIRLFGATIPIKDPAKGHSFTFTGPIQINWGYSLNKVDIVESSSISSTFAGRTKEGTEGSEYGTFGKDWRVYYSLIAFHGIISGKRAEKTNLSEEDVKLFDNAIIEAIPLEATTRSKIGQTPRLYLRLEYKDDRTFLGDLRRYVSLEEREGLRDIGDVKLDLSKLIGKIREFKENIAKIYLWVHPDVKELGDDIKHNFQNNLEDLPHKMK
ncbi:type I-B CRISPR-associated protein Cas7/Csh2 [Desulfonauticus submarinus]